MKSLPFAATILGAVAASVALAQSSYSPPSRPWAVHLENYDMRFPSTDPYGLRNVPSSSHRFHLHLEASFSPDQQHSGYLQLAQANWPGSESTDGSATKKTVDVQIGGPNRWRNNHRDWDTGQEVWDGTWTENCGPNSWQPSVACVGYMSIGFQNDAQGTNYFELFSPVVILYDNQPHVYDVWIDTAAYDTNGNPAYLAEWAIDNTMITAVYDGISPLDGHSFYTFSDYGSYQGSVYFPVDGMNWRLWNDDYDLSPYAEYADTTCPTVDVTRIVIAMNMQMDVDVSGMIATEAWAYRDAGGTLHPANVLTPQYPFGYVPEIHLYGNASVFLTGTATNPWQGHQWLSSEPYNFGTAGQMTDASSDMYQ